VAPGAGLANDLGRFNEINGVIIVLFDTGCDCENVWIKDDVAGREANVLRQDFERALTDFNLARGGIGLAHFIERHDHNRCAIGQALACLLAELVLALFHRDRVHDRLTLNAFKACFDDVPFGAVNHHRDARNIRLSCDQVKECGHRGCAVQHAFVHIDVDNLGAVLNLLARHFDGGWIIACRDQLTEPGRARDIGTLANIDENGGGLGGHI